MRLFVAFIILLNVIVYGAGDLHAQTDIGIEQYWNNGRPGYNIFELSKRVTEDDALHGFDRHLALTYLYIFGGDLGAAEHQLELAKLSEVTQANQPETVDQIYDAERALLRAGGKYEALADLLAQKDGSNNIWTDYYNEFSRYHQIVTNSTTPYELQNVSTTPSSRIAIQAIVNGVSATLLFDTGGTLSIIQPDLAKSAGISLSAVSVPIRGISFEDSLALTGIDEFSIGDLSFVNTPIMVPTSDDSFIAQNLSREFSGILGMTQLSQFGSVAFIVTEQHVSSLRIEHSNTTIGTPETPSNLMIRSDKLFARLLLDGHIYSCLVDTGSPFTAISETIFEKHKTNMELKKVRPRKAKRRGLTGAHSNRPAFVESLQVEVSGELFSLTDIELVDSNKRPPDYCLLGLDSIIEAGGATIDFSKLSIKLGGS